MSRLLAVARRCLLSLAVLLTVFAAATVVQAAVDSWRCGVALRAQVLPTRKPVTCRYTRILAFDSTAGTAVIALGPLVAPESDDAYQVPNFPYGVLCMGAP